MDNALEAEIKELLEAGRRISAVRRYREEFGADLKTATEAIDRLKAAASEPSEQPNQIANAEDEAGKTTPDAPWEPQPEAAWETQEDSPWETQEDVVWATRMRRSFFIFSETFEFPPGRLLLQSEHGGEVRTTRSILADHRIDRNEVQKSVPKEFYFWQPSPDFMKRKQALDPDLTPWSYLRHPAVCPSLLTELEIDELEFTAAQSGDENAASFIPGWIEQRAKKLTTEQWDAVSNAMVALNQEPFDPLLWMSDD